MAGIYSTRFFAGNETGSSTTTVGPVPTGEVWIVTCVTFSTPAANSSTAVAATQLVLSSSSVGFKNVSLAAATSDEWQGRLVVNAGESLALHVVTAGQVVACTMTGYTLTV